MMKVEYYLSRVLAPVNAVRTAYMAHQLLWRGFDKPAGTEQPFLFRQEGPLFMAEGKRNACFLVQSTERPDWDRLKLPQADVKTVAIQLHRGDTFAFRLRASPVKNRVVRDSAGNRGVRGEKTPLRDPVEIAAWFARRAEQAGFVCDQGDYTFTIDDLPISKNEVTPRGGNTPKLANIQFDGILVVENPELFAAALQEGIGPKKSFGFGMLTVTAP